MRNARPTAAVMSMSMAMPMPALRVGTGDMSI